MNWKDASDTETVCYCKNVDKAAIKNTIKAGNNTLQLIRNTTSACTGGNCKEMNPSGKCCSGAILQLIKIYNTEQEGSGTKSCCCCS